jgi:NADPH:quinone reductase-like Zn-dependent oxidoreductase
MKAIVCAEYGSPVVMKLRDVPKPVPKPKEVLIKIHAATVTAGDCEIRRFDIPILFWLPLRLILGISRPRRGIYGQEFAGEVEACGNKISLFQPGDTVFGPTTIGLGAYAQYICVPESHLTKFAVNTMTYAEAATIPTGGINALHFIRKANIKSGESVLINGAGGSIGTYALQLAKSSCAEVTCVDSSSKLSMLTAIGAMDVIDYAEDDFTKDGRTYDVIIDVVGRSSFSRSVRCLKPHGRYVLGNPSFSGMLQALWTSMTSDKKIIFEMAAYKTEDRIFIKELIETGRLKSVIDRQYPLEEVPEAHRYVEAGLKAGNVAILVSHQEK